jgi:uncharacterized integral membrane protein (TIGR00697 family)
LKVTTSKETAFKHLSVVSSIFAATLIISNVASSAKIVDLGVSLFGLPLAFDGGTLLFPLSYVLGDVLAEVYGFRAMRKVIWTGFGCLALASLVCLLLSVLPGEAGWQADVGDSAFNSILGGMSAGGLVIASLAGYLVGEFSNASVLVRIKALMKGRLLFVRTIGSTLVGEFLDSIVFVSVATRLGVFGKELFWTLVTTNYIFKCLIEFVFTPVTYAAVSYLKKAEK